jgi:hypothetical protein
MQKIHAGHIEVAVAKLFSHATKTLINSKTFIAILAWPLLITK